MNSRSRVMHINLINKSDVDFNGTFCIQCKRITIVEEQKKSVNIKGGNKQGPDPDQGGHLLGTQFGGPGEQINLVPMKKSLNQSGGDWYNMEQAWATKIQNGITITDLEINIVYGANGRPTKFVVKWKEDGIAIAPIEHLN